MGRTKIINGQVITPYRIIPQGTVEIEDGKIAYVGERERYFPCDQVIDAGGHYVILTSLLIVTSSRWFWIWLPAVK